jgi:hypothetical protein
MKNTWADKEIEIEGAFKLQGTLSVPGNLEGKAPGVLFIHGSGPLDRDENVKNFPINLFKSLANDLAGMGFATLRYDKRGCGESEGDFYKTGLWDLVDDAQRALGFLKEQTEVDENKIILIGHSEGCVLAPALNAREPVAGIVLLAGIVGGAFDASQYQMDLIFKEIKELKGLKGFFLRILANEDRARKTNAKIYAKIMASEKEVYSFNGKKMSGKWFREHKNYVVDTALQQAECPILAITGSKDVQVKSEYARKIGEIVHSPFEYHIIEDMNHLLRKQEEAPSLLGLKKIYKKSLGEPIDPALIGYLNKWMEQFAQGK